ncbi:MAG: c-type cytochrome [Acidobacteria bacterium]|nr:c-type cytochrome [Acidobacteriota bacterium]
MTKRSLVVAGVLVALMVAVPIAVQQAAPPPASSQRAQDQPFPPGSPFALLPGFKIERVTPADRTESLIVVTFDALGRPVVSQSVSGNGAEPRILLDNDGDGIFETEKIVSDKLNTCHGLFYASRTTLYANCRAVMPGDPPPAPAGRGGAPPAAGNQASDPGIAGFYKLEDINGDDVMDTIERIQRYTSAGMGDHGPHAVRRAPDGSIAFLVGNNTYVGAPAPQGSPVADDVVDKAKSPNWNNLKERQFLPAYNDPRFGNSTRTGVHATVWRLEPGNRYSLQFSGMRNPYDFAYTLGGEAFTFDSDMEWDVNSPWYRENRTIHMIPGGDGGYRNGTGKFQDEYFDTLPALRNMRRGSPVGVETYSSYAYPASFFDNLFEADWSRGRLLYTALTSAGGTYRTREDLAEFVHGEPMPITDLEVGPDGNIYFTTGGNPGTGGLYKVSWTGPKPPQPDMSGIFAAIHQPQPLSSWGWAAIERLKTSMGATAFGVALERAARDTTVAGVDRARAIYELQRHGLPPSAEFLAALVADTDVNVRAAIVYVAGMHTTDGAKAVAASALKDRDSLVQRRAAEALVRQGLDPTRPSFAPIGDIFALFRSPDRFVRYAGRLALEHTPRRDWVALVMNETNVIALTEGLLALTNTVADATQSTQTQSELRPILEKLIALMRDTTLPADQKIRILRTFEVAATEAPGGVDPEIRKTIHDVLITQFPTRPPSATYLGCTNRTEAEAACALTMVAHHMAKVLAYTGEPDVIGKILAVMPKGNEDQPGQIDYFYALRVVDQGWAAAEVRIATDWFAKASKWRGGSTFAGHLNQVFDAVIDAFTPEQQQAAFDAAPLFAPLTPTPATAVTRPTGGPPALTRNVPLDRQERYDNLVFPRGGGPGVLASGRGGGPNVDNGKKTFEAACAQCHRVDAFGSPFGPDLSNIQAMPRRDLLRAIFFPDEKVDPKYETTVIVTRDKQTIRGLIITEDARSVMVKTAEAADPVAVQKSRISSRTKERTSIMPDGLSDTVGDNAIRDVVAYLMSSRK